MDELTEHYVGLLQDSSECVKHFTLQIQTLEGRIQELKKELNEAQEKVLFYMTKDSFSISRHDLSTFFITVKNRRETDEEWNLFQKTFRLKMQILVYNWIDSLAQVAPSMAPSRE